MRSLAPVSLLCALTVLTAPAAGQQPTVTVGGRLQTQFATTSVEGQPSSELFIRRARVEVSVRIDDRVSGTVQPEFAGDQIELKDAYLRLSLSPALEILAGKAHRPFSLIEQTSSKRILPIERGLRIRGLAAADAYALVSGLAYSNRDIGVQLIGAPEGAPLGLAYAVGVFRGPLHGAVGDHASYQTAARLTVRPLPALRLGAGWSARDFARSPETGWEVRRGHAFEVDLEYGSFAPGLHVLVELTRGDRDPFADASFRGAQAWLAWRTGALSGPVLALEPVLRVSHGDPEGGAAAGGTLVTPGLNLHLGPLSRVMVNWDVWLAGAGGADANGFKAMFQLGF